MATLEQQNFLRIPSTASTINRRDATLSSWLAESNSEDDTEYDTESVMTVRGPIKDA